MHYLLSEAILLDRIGVEFFKYQSMVTGTEITDDFGVMSNLLQVHSKMRSRVKKKSPQCPCAAASNSSTNKIPLLVHSFLGPTVCHGA